MARQAGTTLPRIEISSRDAWRAWLESNHSTSGSVWVVTYRKSVADRHVPADALAEEAICFGWIDSLPRKLDARRTMLLLSPRKPTAAWSALNKRRAARMIAAGRMTAAGRAAIARARKNGAWSFLDDVEALRLPADLAAALRSDRAAARHFGAFPRSAVRGILEWIKTARQPQTRARRIAETVRLAALDIRALQPRRTPVGGISTAGKKR